MRARLVVLLITWLEAGCGAGQGQPCKAGGCASGLTCHPDDPGQGVAGGRSASAAGTCQKGAWTPPPSAAEPSGPEPTPAAEAEPPASEEEPGAE